MQRYHILCNLLKKNASHLENKQNANDLQAVFA